MPLMDETGKHTGNLGICHDITRQKMAEISAHNRETEMRVLADSLPALIAYAEATEQRYTFANKAYAQTYGWDVKSIVGHTVREVIGEEAYQVVQPYSDAVVNGQYINYQRELVTPDGQIRFVEGNLIPHTNDDGQVIGAFILLSDITKHRLAERAVRESEERLKKFAAASIDGVVFHDRGIITDCNEAAARLLGREVPDVVGHEIWEFLTQETHEKAQNRIHTGSEQSYEGEVTNASGKRIPIEVIPRTMPYQGRTYRMAVIRDISDRKRAEERIHFMAHHDSLTHLPNRANLMERLAVMLAAAQRYQTFVALIFIDLDHFKTVNDSLGHYAGDTLLRIVAGRLKSCLRDADTISRLGGDEFLVAVPDLRDPQSVIPIAEKLLEVVSESCTIEGQTLSISPSLGISMFPRDGIDADTLIKNADAAMYLAKEHGRANYQFFTPHLSDMAFEALSLESSLRDAIKRNDFVLHYQPQMRIADREIVGIEALVRWQHPEQGLILPGRFIGVAEQRGLIFQIGTWVLEEACRQNMAWQEAGLPAVPIVVNLSAVQFKRRDLVSDVARVLENTGLEGRYLELEVTESVLMEDVATLTNTLLHLKNLGVKIAIDDFGTGYSSLSYLKRFPIDKIKIDRSFVRDLPHDADDLAITSAIISMAQSLKIKVIAEGVETSEQMDLLRERGCDEIQGFYLSRPLPAAELAQLLKARG
jgi:diguanylate cyclase (GGDEF)-like protein/PAS domain S-box-containing protein